MCNLLLEKVFRKNNHSNHSMYNIAGSTQGCDRKLRCLSSTGLVRRYIVHWNNYSHRETIYSFLYIYLRSALRNIACDLQTTWPMCGKPKIIIIITIIIRQWNSYAGFSPPCRFRFLASLWIITYHGNLCCFLIGNLSANLISWFCRDDICFRNKVIKF